MGNSSSRTAAAIAVTAIRSSLWFVGMIMISSGEGHFATTFGKVKGFSRYVAIGLVARVDAF